MLLTYYLWIKSVKTGQIYWAALCSIAYFYSLLDPSYAKNNIPIIASVSEHQPTSWSSFYFDLQILTFLFPAGLYYCFTRMTDHIIFIILYGVTSVYFAGVMVRLMLVLAPVMCIMGGIAVSASLSTYLKYLDMSNFTSSIGNGHTQNGHPQSSNRNDKKYKSKVGALSSSEATTREYVAMFFVAVVTVFLVTYAMHCVWATSEAYSSPSIVLSARSHDGSRIIFDDFREAYWWLRQNTPEDAKIMSWWDYGYQITAMANRTILVDNNTWNNTHISRVGQAMASTEDKAYEIMRELDVNYVLVIFGGLTGYASDDINKFLWMVRIGGSTPEGAHIKEGDYYTGSGEFRVDGEGSSTLLNCMMYKLCYYRFRQVYTSEHWIVRIYKVKDLPNRGTR